MGSQQTRSGLRAGVFETLVRQLRAVVRLAAGRQEDPSAARFESRPLPSTLESGHRAGSQGTKRRKGRTVHTAVETPGKLLALQVPPANEHDRTQGGMFSPRHFLRHTMT